MGTRPSWRARSTRQYDARNRLTTACYGIASTATDCTGASNTIAYSYDKVDNITQQVRAGSVGSTGTTSYSYNSADQLSSTTKSGTTTNFSYDGNGNETGDGTNSFTYNLADQLISSTTGGVTTSYSYDGDGNRLTSQTSGGADLNYSWDPNADSGLPEPILERTSTGGLVRRYLDGPAGAISMSTGSASFCYHHDPLGSISDLTNASGTAQWAYSYEPYGATRSSTNVSGTAPENRLRFDSQYADTQTSTYNLRTREYDPATGRFGGLDPLGGSSGSAALGAYAYADGQPTVLTDPLGLCAPLECFDIALKMAGDALGQTVGSLTDIVDVAFGAVGDELKAQLQETAQWTADTAHAAANSDLIRGMLFGPGSGHESTEYQIGAGIGLALTFFAPELRATVVTETTHVELRNAVAATACLDLSTTTGEKSIKAESLFQGLSIEFWDNGQWACLVGLKTPDVVIAVPSLLKLEWIGELERLDLRGSYDLGGLHRVAFEPLPDEDLLIIHEIGLARVSAAEGFVWQSVHADLTAQFVGVADGLARFDGEDTTYTYRVSSGEAA